MLETPSWPEVEGGSRPIELETLRRTATKSIAAQKNDNTDLSDKNRVLSNASLASVTCNYL